MEPCKICKSFLCSCAKDMEYGIGKNKFSYELPKIELPIKFTYDPPKKITYDPPNKERVRCNCKGFPGPPPCNLCWDTGWRRY